MSAKCSVIANYISVFTRTAQCAVYAPLDTVALTAKTGKLSANCTNLTAVSAPYNA